MEWDKAYINGDYKRHWDSSFPSPELSGFTSSQVNIKDWRVLDVGCGTGEDALFLSNHAHFVYGLDISQTAIEIAKNKIGVNTHNVEFMTGSVFALPFNNNTFDMITDRGCLHNLSFAEWPKYEFEVYRCLKKEGILFVRGARNWKGYEDGFSLIESQNLAKVFHKQRWDTKGPYRLTLFSDAEDGILHANLFILSKVKQE